MKNIFKKPVSLAAYSALVSVVTMLMCYGPFFRFAYEHVDFSTWNAYWLLGSLFLLVPIANFFACYLLLWLTRRVGKALLSITFIINAVCMYFINTYNVMITSTMLGNVFNTKQSEASGFLGGLFVVYVLLMGVLPCVYLIARKIDYGSWKRFLAWVGSSLGMLLIFVFAHTSNWLWIDRYSTELGALTMPWSYTINTIRWYNSERKDNAEEIRLPDGTFLNNDKSLIILVIGESARRDHFSLYGYEKETNPRLKQIPGVKTYMANSSATYTTESVKNIVSYAPSGDLYEILPNYLYRHGAEVIWRANNWGEPPVHVDNFLNWNSIKEIYPDVNTDYDEWMFTGLEDAIRASHKNKVLVVLHTTTSHGPQYSKRYPADFEAFTPVCNSVETSQCSQEELLNAYDNTILYTDYLVAQTIQLAQRLSDYRSTVLYVSDHGESLGEKGLYMHGVPMAMAPKEQYEIPFIIWTSDEHVSFKSIDLVGHFHVYHTILHFLDFESPIYQEELNLFR